MTRIVYPRKQNLPKVYTASDDSNSFWYSWNFEEKIGFIALLLVGVIILFGAIIATSLKFSANIQNSLSKS